MRSGTLVSLALCLYGASALRLKPGMTKEEDYVDQAGDLTTQSWSKSPLKIDGAKKSMSYMSMCITGEAGAQASVKQCLSAVCSLLKVAKPSKDADIVMLVNAHADAQLREQLEAKGVFVVQVPSLVWNKKNSRKVKQPPRLYTFFKFNVWRFTQFERIMWFDSDVFFHKDPIEIANKYSTTPQKFTIAQFPKDNLPEGVVYANSGVFLFQPTIKVYSGLLRKWFDGDYTPAFGTPKHNPKKETEQDVICYALGKGTEQDVLGDWVHMSPCYNYRGYSFQRESCSVDEIVLKHGKFAGALKEQCGMNDVVQTNEISAIRLDMSVTPFYDEGLQ